MKICFITAGPIEWASSRYRAHWVADELRQMGHDAGTIEYKSFKLHEENLAGADVYVWQKTADIEAIKRLPNARHYWDLCDPSWWWQPEECRKIVALMDGVVCSSEALLEDFNQWMPDWERYPIQRLFYIPDRFNLSHFTHRRKHTAVDPVRLIWYGIAANRMALFSVTAMLERAVANGANIELTIMDDRPQDSFLLSTRFPIYHTQWRLDKEIEIIANHDIALLPPYPGEWGKVKSDNKAQLAYGCGLPVLRGVDYGEGYDYLMSLVDDPEARTAVVNSIKLEPVRMSAQEWEAILCES